MLLPPFEEHLGLVQRVKRTVTPIFFTAMSYGLALPHLDFDTRSLRIASSFFPRGMECPPLVLKLTETLSGSGAAIRGAGHYKSEQNALERD